VRSKATPAVRADPGYESVLADVVGLVAAARGMSARTVNAIMTTTYWSIGCRIVEQEQRGAARAGYGEERSGGCHATSASGSAAGSAERTCFR